MLGSFSSVSYRLGRWFLLAYPYAHAEIWSKRNALDLQVIQQRVCRVRSRSFFFFRPESLDDVTLFLIHNCHSVPTGISSSVITVKALLLHPISLQNNSVYSSLLWRPAAAAPFVSLRHGHLSYTGQRLRIRQLGLSTHLFRSAANLARL